MASSSNTWASGNRWGLAPESLNIDRGAADREQWNENVLNAAL